MGRFGPAPKPIENALANATHVRKWEKDVKLKPVLLSLALALAGALHMHAASAAETTLRIITAYPKQHNFNKPLLALIDEVNKEGAGKVKLQLIGGPEALPSGEMLQALSNGIVDIFYGSTNLFIGEIPEAAALNGSNQSAMDLRENGALDLLSKSFEERLNSKYLGYYGSGYTFYIYLLDEPKRTASGGVDLAGWKIRGGAPYQTLLDRQDAVMISLFAPDMYSAMERGVIDGMVWTSVSIAAEGWDAFIKYRIKPNFWQGDISLVSNLAKWNGLTGEQQAFLTEKIAKYERIAHENYAGQAAADEARLKAAGMQDILLEGEAKKEYQMAPVDLFWDGLKKNIPAERVDALRALFYKK